MGARKEEEGGLGNRKWRYSEFLILLFPGFGEFHVDLNSQEKYVKLGQMDGKREVWKL